MTILSAPISHWQLGPLYYDASQRQLADTKQQLYLEPKQHQLLMCLLQTPGQVVSRDTLIMQVWQGRIVSDSAINRAVSILRKAFSRLDNTHNYIETLPKLGYRLQLPPQMVVADVGVSSRLIIRLYRAPVLLVLICLLLVSVAMLWPEPLKHSEEVMLLRLPSVPVTSFNGAEFHISTDSAGTKLLYHRTADNGHNQLWLHNTITKQHQAVSDTLEDARYGRLSPDGSQIAYIRYTNQQCQLMLLHLPEDRFPLQDCPSDSVPQLIWQGDSRALYYRQRTDKTQPYHIFKLSLISGVSRQLTLTAVNYAGEGDIALALSETTQQLAVLRYNTAHSRTLLLLDSESGVVQQQHQINLAVSQLYWHGERLLLVAGSNLYQFAIRQSDMQLVYRAALPINSVTITAEYLYYSSNDSRSDIWRYSRSGGSSLVIDSSRIDSLPRIAPNGSALVFLSNRGGHYQLWQQQPGQQAVVLTELPGEPAFARFSWHPDSSQLVLVKDGAAYTVSVPDGVVRKILPAHSQIAVADWDERGEGLIYSTDRHGDWQLWHYDFSQRAEQLLSVQDGYSGRIWQGQLYYTRYHQDGLWRMNLADGESELLLPELDKINWLNWQLTEGQVLYYQPGNGIYRYDIQTTQQEKLMGQADNFAHHYSVHDNHVYYVKREPAQGDIFRIELSSTNKLQQRQAGN
ncbi:DNA-binding winged helix-turn-helix (wHTH) protein/Tol biopolymer transport system component [Rheinheimera pacifica]|uniref:winged helix-turn-helix domain-containing protein n=1 Tax=Rheinheimera pacifica TaxID=173990 RepID=UPI002861ADA7|nr:winged helix-turn-helix domain-containing protein [Rheinheimera pacifica]MDR6984973.1 DNA-binding winged helix-turn-helix (wHTH) protein/Tol biopolymer transport system component [Rheinheimera pacifica]